MNKKIVSFLFSFVMILSSGVSAVYAEAELTPEMQTAYKLMEDYINNNYLGDATIYVSNDNKIIINFRKVSENENDFDGATISKNISEYLEMNNIDPSKVDIRFRVNVPEKTYLGDVDLNGTIDVTDLTELSLALIGDKELTAAQQKSADIDGDGAVTLADLARLQQYLSKKIDAL